MPNSCVPLQSCSSPEFCTKLWLLPSHSTLLNYCSPPLPPPRFRPGAFALFGILQSLFIHSPLAFQHFAQDPFSTVFLSHLSPQWCLWIVSLLVLRVPYWLDCCSFLKGAVAKTLMLTSITWRGCVCTDLPNAFSLFPL